MAKFLVIGQIAKYLHCSKGTWLIYFCGSPKIFLQPLLFDLLFLSLKVFCAYFLE